MILTSMEPNIFRMLFSLKNQKVMMLEASCTLGWPKKPMLYMVITENTFSHVFNISCRAQVFWVQVGKVGLQHHNFFIFDE